MSNQTTSRVLMVAPTHFGWNAETAETNTFMQKPGQESPSAIRAQAEAEFSGVRNALVQAGVHVEVASVDAHTPPRTPDAVFPNNWFSTHESGELVLYPMAAPSRRAERRAEFIELIRKVRGGAWESARIVDLSALENDGIFLEGTGSLILDRANRIAYAGLSPRTHQQALKQFAQRLGYEVVAFPIRDAQGREIYHTNVMM